MAEDPVMKVYLEEIARIPLLKPEEESRLARKATRGDRNARNRLATANLRLVVSIARKYRSRGVSLSDLISEGNIGLLHAIEKFDPYLGYRFSTYATWWIRQAILRLVSQCPGDVHVPSRMTFLLSRYREAENHLRDSSGARPGRQEIARHLGITMSKLMDVEKAGAACAVHNGSEEGDVRPVERNPSPNAASPALDVAVKDQIDALFGKLEEREARVLELRFGLGDGKQRTLKEIGSGLKLSKERVRQIEKGAIQKLASMS